MTEPNDLPPGDNPPTSPPDDSGRGAPDDAPGGPDDTAERPAATASGEESRTHIIRRAPTRAMPATEDPTHTTRISGRPAPWDATARPGRRGALTSDPGEPSARTAVAACAVSIVSGWAASVVATELIAAWWRSEWLFCFAVAFLALVFGLATVAGVIMLLLRRSLGRYLIVAGAVIALLTYVGLFIAGARVAWIVYVLPVLPLASVVLALHRQTKRWLLEG